jgi:hypothetical protein
MVNWQEDLSAGYPFMDEIEDLVNAAYCGHQQYDWVSTPTYLA